MKLVSYTAAGGRRHRLGALLSDGARVVDLTGATAERLVAEGVTRPGADRLAAALCPPDVVRFAEAAPHSLEAAAATLEAAERGGVEADDDGQPLVTPLDELTFLPSVPRPTVLRDFLAFEEHLLNIYPKLGRSIPPEWYEMPVYYKGNHHSVGAHGATVAMPSYADELDLEMEVAIVIGRPGKDIAVADARSHIFGYTVYNDVSARAIQAKEVAVGLGPAKAKDFDGAHVLGPWVVTADEVPDPYALELAVEVNGREWMTGSTASMTWRFEDMIAHASRGETLRTGEVLGSGTAGNGSGAERGEFLHPGDRVDLRVAGIGRLTTYVGGHPATTAVTAAAGRDMPTSSDRKG